MVLQASKSASQQDEVQSLFLYITYNKQVWWTYLPCLVPTWQKILCHKLKPLRSVATLSELKVVSYWITWLKKLNQVNFYEEPKLIQTFRNSFWFTRLCFVTCFSSKCLLHALRLELMAKFCQVLLIKRGWLGVSQAGTWMRGERFKCLGAW